MPGHSHLARMRCSARSTPTTRKRSASIYVVPRGHCFHPGGDDFVAADHPRRRGEAVRDREVSSSCRAAVVEPAPGAFYCGAMNRTRIAESRSLRGWTQERLAEVSGVTVRTVQRLEAGNDVSLNTLARLGEALGVPVRELFETVPENAYGKALSALNRTEVQDFLSAAGAAWLRIALAVSMLVGSPIPVALLIATADAGMVPTRVEVAIARRPWVAYAHLCFRWAVSRAGVHPPRPLRDDSS